jgi:hypothetical protein
LGKGATDDTGAQHAAGQKADKAGAKQKFPRADKLRHDYFPPAYGRRKGMPYTQ